MLVAKRSYVAWRVGVWTTAQNTLNAIATPQVSLAFIRSTSAYD
jgi:hypothetical protein